ncbi:hypothetical protein QUC31_011657 [Theobroma cacao]
MSTSDPSKLISKADKLTKLSLTRWSADWKSATVLYEQAANGFRVARNYEKAKLAFEKASQGQEMLSSPWDAAKHMESAAALAKELRNWAEVIDFYRKASELYMQCDRPQPASDALAKGARALEDALPDDAIQLYTDACVILEDDGKEQMAFDLYRAATSVYVKLEKIDAFLGSDQNRCASKLLSAYTEGDVEEIKRVAQSSAISNLDNVIIKLARKLPTGDVSAFKTDAANEEEPLDENDLT